MVARTLPTDLRSAASWELERIRSLGSARPLGDVARNPTTWKLALPIYPNDNLNISGAIGALQNWSLSHSSILRFIQERMAQGSIVWRHGDKKSEKHIVLHPDLRQELDAYLTQNLLGGPVRHGLADGSSQRRANRGAAIDGRQADAAPGEQGPGLGNGVFPS